MRTVFRNHRGVCEVYVKRAREFADQFWNSREDASTAKMCWDACIEEAKDYAEYHNCVDLLPPLFGCELEGPKAKAKLQASDPRVRGW